MAWWELDRDGEGYPGASYSNLDISYVELQALQAIGEGGGASTLGTVADQLWVPRQQVSALCRGLAQQDYIDLYQSGLIRMKRRGWQELKQAGYRSSTSSELGIGLGGAPGTESHRRGGW